MPALLGVFIIKQFNLQGSANLLGRPNQSFISILNSINLTPELFKLQNGLRQSRLPTVCVVKSCRVGVQRTLNENYIFRMGQ